MTPPILIIECTTVTLSVGLIHHGTCASLSPESHLQSSEAILPTIDTLLTRHTLTPRDLGAVAVAGGPGSFTSLRIGASVSKGLALALDIPLLSIPILKAYASAWRVFTPETECQNGIVLQHAKADSFYCCALNGRDLGDVNYATSEEIEQRLLSERQATLDGSPRLILRHSGLRRYFSDRVKTDSLPDFSACGLSSLVLEEFNSGQFISPEDTTPGYYKEFEARKKGAGSGG